MCVCVWECVRACVFSCPSHCPCHTGPSAAGLVAGWTARVKVSPPLIWPTGCHFNSPTTGRVCRLVRTHTHARTHTHILPNDKLTHIQINTLACLKCTHKLTDSTLCLCRITHSRRGPRPPVDWQLGLLLLILPAVKAEQQHPNGKWTHFLTRWVQGCGTRPYLVSGGG